MAATVSWSAESKLKLDCRLQTLKNKKKEPKPAEVTELNAKKWPDHWLAGAAEASRCRPLTSDFWMAKKSAGNKSFVRLYVHHFSVESPLGCSAGTFRIFVVVVLDSRMEDVEGFRSGWGRIPGSGGCGRRAPYRCCVIFLRLLKPTIPR